MPVKFGLRCRLGSAVLPLCMLSLASQAADGLVVDIDGFASAATAAWPQVQARIQWGSEPDASRSGGTVDFGTRAQRTQVLGDYYFAQDTARQGLVPRGWRATSGLWLASNNSTGTSGPPQASGDPAVAPYLGLGYSAMSDWGLSLNADLGLLAHQGGEGIRPGRAYTGQRTLDDLARDLQWLPILQLGVSYSF